MSLIGAWGSASSRPPQVDAAVDVDAAPAEPDWQALKQSVHRRLLEVLGPTLYDAHMPEHELAAKVRAALQAALAGDAADVGEDGRARLTSDILDDILGLGPIQPFLLDPDVTEVMVNAYDQVYVERHGLLHRTPVTFSSEQHLRRTIEKIVSRVGRRVDESSPMVDARLLDGSRVNAVVPPIALKGCSLTIRKFATDPFSAQDLVDLGTMTAPVRDFLDRCVRGRLNIVVSGGTGSGKTTSLNVMSSFIPDDERIVTVEDAAELKLHQEHVVSLESRPANIEGQGLITVRDLVRNALRMRPDRIVVGEVRDGAALDMLQAMNTGHDGSITTLHSNSPRDTLARLETMVLMAGMDLPIRAIREQVASGIDLIVHQSRLRDGSRRITHVTEVLGMESDVITTQDTYRFDFAKGLDEHGRFLGTLRPTGLRPRFTDRLRDVGIDLGPELFQDGS